VHRGRGLLNDFLCQHPHGVVVTVGFVDLQGGELGVVLEVHALIAELPADLEHLLHAAHDEALEVQLGGNPQIEIKIVGVDVCLERPCIGAPVDHLQNRRLDLGEASNVERLANAAYDVGADIGDLAGFWSHDQVHIACSDAGFRVSKTLVLIRKRSDRLAGDLEGFGAYGQLTALGGDHLAGHAHVITEVDILPPVSEHVGSNSIESDHDLEISGAVTQSGEAEFSAVPIEDDPSSDRDLLPRTRIGRQLTGFGSNLGQRMGTQKHHRVGVDALLPQPFQLLAAYPDLFRKSFS
jgi:hypothetical protein